MRTALSVFAVILYFGVPVLSHKSYRSNNALSPKVVKACRQIMSLDAVTSPCCVSLDECRGFVTACKKETGQYNVTCAIADCTINKYSKTIMQYKDGKVVLSEPDIVDRLKIEAEDPCLTREAHRLGAVCLRDQYKQYNVGPVRQVYENCGDNCDSLLLLSCGVVSYYLGCEGFRTWLPGCRDIKRSVRICKPYFNQFLRQSGSMNSQNYN